MTSSEFKDEHSGVLPDRFGQCFLKCSRKTEIEESDNKDDDLSIFAKDNESKIPVTVNAEKSWTFPNKSWTLTQNKLDISQKKLDIDPKKVEHFQK